VRVTGQWLRPLAIVIGLAARSTGSVPVDANAAATAGNAFSQDLYRRLCGQEGNLFFSPYSLSTAMALTYPGARGTTAAQMAGTLHWLTSDRQKRPWSPAQLAQSLGSLIRDQGQRDGQGKVELAVANALWAQKDVTLLADFLRAVETGYGGGLHRVDFIGDCEAARMTINTWVEDQTRKQIQDLVPRGVLDPATRLVLTNAVYFKGGWAHPFVKERTQTRPFTSTAGKSPEVSLMTQTGRFAYAEANDLQVLEMPYAGEGLSMVILLPRRPDGLARVEKTLTAETIAAWLGDMKSREVRVFVPRFRLSGQFSLAEVLKSMGMTDAFSRQADFSGMTGRRDLYISAILHKAFVAVDEEGTEAAAATGMAMQLTSVVAPAKVVVFCANHPFVFLIRDRASGAILFMGRFVDPGQAG
jgi:serine protease inhibitor